MDDQEIMARMEKIKSKLDASKAEKARLTGEIQAKEQALKELEDKCKEEFNVSLDELSGLIDSQHAKIEEEQKKLGDLLGV